MQRVERNSTGESLRKEWRDPSSGALLDPGSVTIAITRADGTTMVAAGTSVSGGGAAARTFPLTLAHTALLDTLTVTWESSTYGPRAPEYVEIVGGFLFNLSELADDVSNTTETYSAAQMGAARTYGETQLENAIGLAQVPRFSVYRTSGMATPLLSIPRYALRTVRWVQVGGVALSPSEVSAIEVGDSALYGTAWTRGYGNIRIGFEHGLDYPDPGASEAARVLAAHHLIKGPIDDRATQRPSEFGPVNLSTPGMFGSRFGFPVVDAYVKANTIPGVA